MGESNTFLLKGQGAHKQTISYSDMLAALRRELIRAEYLPQAPGTIITPQILSAPSPSAVANA